MTYFGAEKVIPHYNVMGVAKAALETCVRYLAFDLGAARDPRQRHLRRPAAHPLRRPASAASRAMLHHHEERAPLRRNITAEEVADAALYLCSDLGSGVTGEVLHVDAGYNVVGM